MKKNKLFTALAAFTMVSGAAFAETEFSVSNKVSSDIVNIEKVEDDSDTSFAGIENKTSFEFTSEMAILILKFVLLNMLDLNSMKKSLQPAHIFQYGMIMLQQVTLEAI